MSVSNGAEARITNAATMAGGRPMRSESRPKTIPPAMLAAPSSEDTRLVELWLQPASWSWVMKK